MANYIVIGGDQKEYGPITTEDVRKWIAEGRLNAQSMMKAESDAEWRPLSAFPEFADAFGVRAATPDAPPFASSPDWTERDYELNIGGCISRGWELLKNNFGRLFFGTLIYLLIEGAIAGLGMIPLIGPLFSIVNLFIAGPLAGGVFFIFLQTIRHQPASVSDVFAGFQKAFLQLFLGYLIPSLLAGLCLIPFMIFLMVKIFPSIANLQPGAVNNAEVLALMKTAIYGSWPVMLICLIPLIYLQVSWMFTLPLIIDKQMSFWSAMGTSWKMVNKHWWQVFGLLILIWLLSMAGILACCVGLLFTAPIAIGSVMFAYETIFSATPTQTD